MWILSARERENVYVSKSRALQYVHSYIVADLTAALNRPLQSTGSWPLVRRELKRPGRGGGKSVLHIQVYSHRHQGWQMRITKTSTWIQRNVCMSIYHVSANVNISSKLQPWEVGLPSNDILQKVLSFFALAPWRYHDSAGALARYLFHHSLFSLLPSPLKLVLHWFSILQEFKKGEQTGRQVLREYYRSIEHTWVPTEWESGAKQRIAE